MKLVIEWPHKQYGSAIFVKPHIDIVSASLTHNNNTEILCIELKSCVIVSKNFQTVKQLQWTKQFQEPFQEAADQIIY